MSKADAQKEEIRLRAESDLEFFINLVHPQRVLGAVHRDLINWWCSPEAKSHQLVLLPRDHGKSAMVGYRVAWEITKNPCIRVLYISSTALLAIKQLKFIKDILTSKTYRRYWPDMVHVDEGKREKWTETEVTVDHPLRKAEAIRDPTVITAGLTTNIVGLHCDVCVLDDIVTNDTAYTEEGRERVKSQYSLLSSIEGTQAREWVVGTRYHPKDLYSDLLSMTVKQYDKEGELSGEEHLYDKYEKAVEDAGDGSGEYLWPLQFRYDGTPFGFNRTILERKRAQYLDKVQFRAQYYNDPNDPSGGGINREHFQYYDPKHLSRSNGKWYFKQKRLNVYASIDFAFSLSKRADYTAIVVVGIDSDRNYYVLAIDRFKTNLISEYFAHVLALHQKWDFRELRAEVSVAQKSIVEDIKLNYIRKLGLSLIVRDYRPQRAEGTKEERTYSILQPRYENRQMWHYMGGYCQTLEEELVLQNPPHDDCRDALASCVDPEFCLAPSHNLGGFGITNRPTLDRSLVHSRFGGIQ